MSDYGSIKKLNWKPPVIRERIEKALSHKEKVEVFYRNGSPATRRGLSGLSPAMPKELSPSLVVKAVRQPVKYTPEGPQFQRKRGPNGQFVASQDAGEQSTADEDRVKLEREGKAREAKNRKLAEKFRRVRKFEKGIPGASNIDDSITGVNDATSQMIGSTNSGMPVYEDPNHSEHMNFTSNDHMEAAQLNQNMAQQMANDPVSAAKYSNNSQAHMQMANDNQMPGDRFMDNLMSDSEVPAMPPGGMPEISQDPTMPSMAQDPSMAVAGPDPMNSFMDLLGEPDPMMQQQNPAMGGGNMMQPPQDPMMQQQMPQTPQDPMMQQDPMAPQLDPIEQQQDPMSNFMTDQNKPEIEEPANGPKPGMYDNRTDSPIGEQTDPGMSSAGAGLEEAMAQEEDSSLDLDSLFGETEEEYGSDDVDEVEDPPSETFSDAPEGGGDLEKDNEENKKKEAIDKALKALINWG